MVYCSHHTAENVENGSLLDQHHLSTSRVQEFSALGKCSWERDLYQSDFETNMDTGRAKGQIDVGLGTLSKANLRSMLTKQWAFSGLPWYSSPGCVSKNGYLAATL